MQYIKALLWIFPYHYSIFNFEKLTMNLRDIKIFLKKNWVLKIIFSSNQLIYFHTTTYVSGVHISYAKKLILCLKKNFMTSIFKIGIICLCLLNVSHGRIIFEKSPGPQLIQEEDLGPSEEFEVSTRSSTIYYLLIFYWMDITLTYCFTPPAVYLIIFLTVARILFSAAIYTFLCIFVFTDLTRVHHLTTIF